MIPRLDWKTWCGSLAVIGTMLLLSPGVQVVQASGEGDLANLRALRPGPTCEVSSSAASSVAREAARAQRAKLLSLKHAQAGSDEMIVLNSRGYNYLLPGGLEHRLRGQQQP